MKKFILFCAAFMAAVNVNAEIVEMTCAKAKSYTLDSLQAGETGTDSVAVTGFVTQTNGSISHGQQTFWLDDEKGTTQTFQGYWCNMPDGENPLNVGDKVTIKGFLMNYNGTAEMKNGDVYILERVDIKIDTLDASPCEAIEEGLSLNNRAVSDEYFRVRGRVVSIDKTDATYMQTTFWLACNDTARFEAYSVTMQDTVFAEINDSVLVLGKLTNYNGTIEIANGKAWILEKGVAPQIQQITVAEALAIGQGLAQGAKTDELYIVKGYVDSIVAPYDENYGNLSFFITDDMNAPEYTFEIFRGKFSADIPVGTFVYAKGQIQHYYQAAQDEKEEIDAIQLSNATVYLENPDDALDYIQTSVKAVKIIEEGQVYILRDGVRYSILGTKIY